MKKVIHILITNCLLPSLYSCSVVALRAPRTGIAMYTSTAPQRWWVPGRPVGFLSPAVNRRQMWVYSLVSFMVENNGTICVCMCFHSYMYFTSTPGTFDSFDVSVNNVLSGYPFLFLCQHFLCAILPYGTLSVKVEWFSLCSHSLLFYSTFFIPYRKS